MLTLHPKLLGILCIANLACEAGVIESAKVSFEELDGIRIVSPLENSNHQAFELNTWGELQTTLQVEVEFGDLDRVEVQVSGNVAVTLYQSNVRGEIVLPADGATEMVFSGYRDDVLVSSQKRDVFVTEPTGLSCTELLDVYGAQWNEASASPGIETPVSLQLPLNGMNYRYAEFDALRSNLYLDCDLALALVRSNPTFLKNDIATVIDLGIYNYRCIGGEGLPPDCPQGISSHANGKAIDIYGVQLNNSQTYILENDWNIDSEDVETCQSEPSDQADKILHHLFCEQKRLGIWNTVLTPNYNSAHRNHVHLDLREGNDFIRNKAH